MSIRINNYDTTSTLLFRRARKDEKDDIPTSTPFLTLLTLFPFCWWRQYRLRNAIWDTTLQNMGMRKVIPNSLGIFFIHGDIHGRSCKNCQILVRFANISLLNSYFYSSWLHHCNLMIVPVSVKEFLRKCHYLITTKYSNMRNISIVFGGPFYIFLLYQWRVSHTYQWEKNAYLFMIISLLTLNDMTNSH